MGGIQDNSTTQNKVLTDAINLLNGSGTISIKGNISIKADFDFPNGINIKFFNDSMLIVDPGVNVSINGSINAGVFQIFKNEGNINGNPNIDCVFPEWFGAKADGITDDYYAIQNALSLKKPLVLQSGKQYNFSSTLIAYNSILGAANLVITSSTLENAIEIDNSSFFEFRDFSIRSEITNDLWGAGKHGINIKNSFMFKVFNIEVSYFTDAVSISDSNKFEVSKNNLHDVGEEPIVIRRSTSWTLAYNDCHNHNGDGILIKGGSIDYDYEGSSIIYNKIHTGVNIYGYSTKGGGITCNTEDNQTIPVKGLKIHGNEIKDVVYGITLLGAFYFTISENTIENIIISGDDPNGISGKGIWINNDLSPYNPQNVSSGHGVISQNIVKNVTKNEGIVVKTTGGIINKPTLVIGNLIILDNIVQNAMRVENCTVTGNHIYGGKTSLTAINCSVTANYFYPTDTQIDAGIKLFSFTSFIGNVAKGYNNFIQIRDDFDGSIVGNTIETDSSQNVIMIINGAKGIAIGNNLTNLGTGGRIQKIEGFSIDSYTSDKKIQQINSSPPSTGTWNRGDIIYNSLPNAGGKIGWVCVTGGGPGTWKAFGSIDI